MKNLKQDISSLFVDIKLTKDNSHIKSNPNENFADNRHLKVRWERAPAC